MNVARYKDKRFVVTIDRSTMERGYVLRTIEPDGSHKQIGKPLKRDAFTAEFGFDPIWPHQHTNRKNDHDQHE